MENFLNYLNYLIDEVCELDKEKVKQYNDFIMLYLSRYENKKITSMFRYYSGFGVISLCDLKDDSFCCRVFVTSSGITIAINKSFYGQDSSELYTSEEYLEVNDYGFSGIIEDFVYDESGIIYNNLPENGPGTHYVNTGRNVYTIFTNEKIVNDQGKDVYQFSSDDNVVIYDELMNYHLNKKNEIYQDYYIGIDDASYDVRNVNILEASEMIEDEVKLEQVNENKYHMINDRVTSLYMLLCNELNKDIQDNIINNIDLVGIMLKRVTDNYKLSEPVYISDEESYNFTIDIDDLVDGCLVIQPEKLYLVIKQKTPNKKKSVEDYLFINSDFYNGQISNILPVNEMGEKHYLPCSTLFSINGIQDELGLIPFDSEDNEGKFKEILELHNAQVDALLEEFSNRSKTNYIHTHSELTGNVNPDSVMLKNGKIHYKKYKGGKK